jgi:hypothetical protein
LVETVEKLNTSKLGTRRSCGQGAVQADADPSQSRQLRASASASQPRLRGHGIPVDNGLLSAPRI